MPLQSIRAIRTEGSPAAIFAALGAVILLGTLLFLQRDYDRTRDSLREHLQSSAESLESSVSALLAQSALSLRGMDEELAARGNPDARYDRAVLADAMRFDPLSAYLGIARPGGTISAIARPGQPLPSFPQGPWNAIDGSVHPGELHFYPVVRIGSDDRWYLPLAMHLSSSTSRGVAFALVDVTELEPVARAIALFTAGRAGFRSPDGTRLFKVLPGGKATAATETVGAGAPLDRASGLMHDRIDGGEGSVLLGFSRSSALPLMTVVGVPESEILPQWLRHSALAIGLLILALAILAITGVHQHRVFRQLRYAATHDASTGLLNGPTFHQTLRNWIADHPGQRFGIVVANIVHLEEIGDTYGWMTAFEVMETIGQRLRAMPGARDLIFWRASTLSVGVLHTRAQSVADLEDLAREMRDSVAVAVPYAGAEIEIALTSAGVLYPDDADSANEVVRCGYIAAKHAASTWKSYFHYSADIDDFSPDVAELRVDLGKAIRLGELHLAYQPKIDLKTRTVVGVEALVRWNHKQRGPLAPIQFLPIAEGSELIHPLTATILELALTQARSWLDAGYRIPVAVNISLHNLLDPFFVETVVRTLDRLRVPTDLLELELTETAVMQEPAKVEERMKELREMGIRLAIDDFGTGYTSIAYLKSLPVHVLKVDRSFIDRLDQDEGNRRIVASALSLAEVFGMDVVAEGVETPAVARVLADMGCTIGQGYHFARPLPPHAVIELAEEMLERSPQRQRISYAI